MKKIIIFDNHKIPRKFRGKEIFVREKGFFIEISQYEYAKKNPHTKEWEYAASGKFSKTGRHIIEISDKKNIVRKIIYLYPTEYRIVSLKSERVVKE